MSPTVLLPVSNNAASDAFVGATAPLLAALGLSAKLATVIDSDSSRNGANALLGKHQKTLQAGGAKMAASQVVTDKHPVDGIVVAAKGCDFVAMATHGLLISQRFVLGSVTQGVIGEIDVPVLAARLEDGTKPFMFKSALVAYDGSDLSKHALRSFLPIAKALQTKLRIVYSHEVNKSHPTNETMRKVINTFLAGAVELVNAEAPGLAVQTSFQEVNQHPADAIASLVEHDNYDVVVLATHGQRARRRLLGSVAEGILRQSSVPVFMVPAKAYHKATGKPAPSGIEA